LIPIAIPACTPRTILIETGSDQNRASGEFSYADWSLTLSRAVDGNHVNYARSEAFQPSLDRFLSLAAGVGPSSRPVLFPSREARLAYFINCYTRADLDVAYGFQIDGDAATPGMLRAAAMREASDDWRVRFALCNGRAGDPPLYKRPYLPELLDAQLTEATKHAMTLPQIVLIDHAAPRRLMLWRGLYDIRGMLVADYERRLKTRQATILNVLLEWADASRRIDLNSAIGYEVGCLPFDRRINDVEVAGR
jgi:hypothetical protein